MTDPNDGWFTLYQEYERIYRNIIDALKLEHITETQDDPKAVPVASAGGFFRMVR
jgi:hypothetical protein